MSQPQQTMADSQKPLANRKTSNLAVVILCLGFVGGMTGLAYAAVPLYKLFCQVTGYGGTTKKADEYVGEISDTVIRVSFDTNISSELNWQFKPQQRSIEVRLGEKSTAIFLARNLGSDVTSGTAIFNVTPQWTGRYFNKIECFCFTEQTLAAGEEVEMPVLFFIDPAIADDPLLKSIQTITLSYTLFSKDKSEPQDSALLDQPNTHIDSHIHEPVAVN